MKFSLIIGKYLKFGQEFGPPNQVLYCTYGENVIRQSGSSPPVQYTIAKESDKIAVLLFTSAFLSLSDEQHGGSSSSSLILMSSNFADKRFSQHLKEQK